MSDRVISILLLGAGVLYSVWGLVEFRSGRARLSWPGRVFSFEEDTLLYSILVAVKFLVLPLAVLISWLILREVQA